jgi:hypothetical protein
MGNTEVGIRAEIHLQYQSPSSKHILARNVSHSCILDSRIPDDQEQNNSSAVETTLHYRIVQVINVLKNTDLLRAQISLEHYLNSLLI